MPLAKFPKSFGFSELKKRYFPHLFDKEDNHVGSIPALDYYVPDSLNSEGKDKLIKWHIGRVAEGYVFDFQKEISEYCINDIEILAQAYLWFRN